MAATKNLSCFHCGELIEVTGLVGRSESCPKCDSDLHCCLNCQHYDPSVANECRETQAEAVRIKDRSNFCDYFEPIARASRGGRKGQEAARNTWDKLFKK